MGRIFSHQLKYTYTLLTPINEKEVAISRNLLIFSAPELGLEPRTL